MQIQYIYCVFFVARHVLLRCSAASMDTNESKQSTYTHVTDSSRPGGKGIQPLAVKKSSNPRIRSVWPVEHTGCPSGSERTGSPSNAYLPVHSSLIQLVPSGCPDGCTRSKSWKPECKPECKPKTDPKTSDVYDVSGIKPQTDRPTSALGFGRARRRPRLRRQRCKGHRGASAGLLARRLGPRG